MNYYQSQPPETGLFKVFESHKGHPWIFLRPLGNWGDELIFAGAERMAKKLGLEWNSVETAEFENLEISDDHCIYLHGGGGFNQWCSGRAIVNLKMALNRSAHLVVQGPITTEESNDWLTDRIKDALFESKVRKVIVFAREEHSLGILNEMKLSDLGVNLCIDHDTALFLTKEDVLSIAELKSIPDGSYELVAYRDDPEQPIQATAETLNTECASPRGIRFDPVYEATSFRHWIRIHLYSKSIVTNRLHSSILAAIVGKPVTLGPGSYHKNRSVWAFSLSKRGVCWADEVGLPSTGIWNRLPRRLQDSYKIRRLRLALNRVPLS